MLLNGTKKGKLLIVAIAIAFLLIIILLIRFFIGFLRVCEAQIEDTNGLSKELCTIDDTFIESKTEYCDMVGINTKYDASKKSGVKNDFKEKDLCYSKDTIKSLSGIYICNAYKANGNVVKYTVDSVVKRGNLRIVITDQNNKILYDVPIDISYDIEFSTTEGQIYYVKLVGESANIEVSVTRND